MADVCVRVSVRLSLGFLPTALFHQAFTTYVNGRRVASLQRRYPRLTNFLEYVSRVYVCRTATFRPSMWNVYARTIDTGTNNHVER